jgi:hypothetical protein
MEPSGSGSGVPAPSFSTHQATEADLCGGLSPCDAQQTGGQDGFYWLPSLMSNPGDVGDYFPGLLDLLHVEIRYVGTDDNGILVDQCSGALPPDWCATIEEAARGPLSELDEDEAGGFYVASWKNPSPKGQRTCEETDGCKPAETVWSVQAFLTLPGETAQLLGYRWVKLSDNPNAVNPANGITLDVKNGSNQDIKFKLVSDGGCFGTASDPSGGFVQCLLNLGIGGTLTLGGTVAQIGQEPTGGLVTLTGVPCSATSYTVSDGNNGYNIDTDLEAYGPCTEWTFTGPAAQGLSLVNSYLWSCDAITSGNLEMLTSYAVHQANGDGTQALPPPTTSLTAQECADLTASQPTGLEALFGKLAGLFRPEPVWATHGGGGGRLGTARSAYQLLHSASASPDMPTTVTSAPGARQAIKVQVSDHDGFGPSVPGANDDGDDVNDTTIRFFALNADGTALQTDADVYLDCNGRAGCVDSNSDATLSQWQAVFTTGSDGNAEVDVIVDTEAITVAALGCDVAVPGNPTPAVNTFPTPDGVARDGAHCNRLPTDKDDGNHGYANGTEASAASGFAFHPFIPGPELLDVTTPPMWTNDLPILFTVLSFFECSPEDLNLEAAGDIRFCGFSYDGTTVTFQMMVEGQLAADFQYRLTVSNPANGSTTIKLNDLDKLTTSKGLKADFTVDGSLLTLTFDAAKIDWDGSSELLYYWEAQKGTQGQQGAGFPDTSSECSTLSGCP